MAVTGRDRDTGTMTVTASGRDRDTRTVTVTISICVKIIVLCDAFSQATVLKASKLPLVTDSLALCTIITSHPSRRDHDPATMPG